MKKTFFAFAFAALCALPAAAQEPDTAELTARAGVARDVLTGETVTMDASQSTFPDDGNTEFSWNMDDGAVLKGERVKHVYKKPGTYRARLTVSHKGEQSDDSTLVRVFRSENILIVDNSVPAERIAELRKKAFESDVFLNVISPEPGESLSDDAVQNKVANLRQNLARAPLIFVWTAGNRSADILVGLGQTFAKDPATKTPQIFMDEKGVVIATEQNFSLVARPAQTAFSILRPKYVLLARPESLLALVDVMDSDEALDISRKESMESWHLGAHSARAVEDLRPWNALSFVVNNLVNWGVPLTNIVLILMLPVVATILAFSRQIIGFKAFGIFTPAAVTLSFVSIGPRFGLIIFAIILLTATASRILLRKFRLLYLPRMAVVLTAVALSILAAYGIGRLTDQRALLGFSIFPILILAFLAEQFVDAQIRFGFRDAVRLTIETLAISLVATFIINWEWFRSLIIGFPEVGLLTVPINIVLGRWTGLRLTEYMRFRKLIVPD